MTVLVAGAEAFVDGSCGCQFALCPLRVRVINVIGEASIGPHLLWVYVYRLSMAGEAVDTRELLVIRAAFEAACARGLPRNPRPFIPRPRKEVSSRAPAV